MSRIEQINELLKSELANFITREVTLENCLITISYVDCSSDFKNAKIGVSVLPEKFSGTALKKLRNCSGLFAKRLGSKLRFRKIPRLNWIIDLTERKAAEIDKLLNEIK